MLPAHLIGLRSDARPIDRAKVKAIADSIREVGMLNPIVVVPGKRIRNGMEADGWDILAGQHRFKAAHEILNWAEVPCLIHDGSDLQAELVMIDENLMRHDLTPAQYAYQTARRKEIYETLHPETKGGVAGANAKHGRANENISFADSASVSTGRNKRTIELDAARGAELGEDLKRIEGTSLDKGRELEALRRMPAEERQPLIEAAEHGETVSARAVIEAGTGEVERQVERLMSAWRVACKAARDSFMDRVASV